MKPNLLKLFILMVVCTFFYSGVQAAFLKNVPVTIVQPSGDSIHVFATGDEYFYRIHDANDFTIIRDGTTGSYVFATLSEDVLVPTGFVVGQTDPSLTNLQPGICISPLKWKQLRQEFWENTPAKPDLGGGSLLPSTSGTINNIVVFIRFSDQTAYTSSISGYNNMFNTNTSGANSMYNYFKEVSYNSLFITSGFYPTQSGSVVVSYQDSHPRNYYVPYNATTNPIGYQSSQRASREHALLAGAINAIASQVPTSLNLDFDNDGYVDNVCFIIRGATTDWSTLLWPHRWSLYSQSVSINNKTVWDYNFQIEDHLANSGNGVLCHEMFHTLGSPDLYHYTSDGNSPVGGWDIMQTTPNPPQSMGAFMKFKYGGWISSIPSITASGTYTLNPVTSSTNNCYKLVSPNSSSEYFVFEFRKKTGTFENSLPGSGLLIYRINTLAGDGNADGPPDEVYVYRPGGTPTANGTPNSANFSTEVGRTQFNNTTDPYCFFSDGSLAGISISNITSSAGATISFTYNSGSVTTYTITTAASPTAGGTTSGGGTFASGQTCTVVAAPNSGYTFTHWSENGILVTATLSYSFTVSANRSLVANFICTPAQPGNITGNTTVCAGSYQTYSIAPVTGATSYTWTLPTGWTGSSTTTTINTTAGTAPGNISVVANNSCGPSPAKVSYVNIASTSPAPTAANASPAVITSGQSSVLTATGVQLGTGAVLKWYSAQCGGTFVGTGTSITVSPTSTTVYYARIEGSCNTTSCVSTTVTVNSIQQVTVTAAAVSTCPGSISVPVTATAVTDLGSIALCLAFNSAVLTYTGYSGVNQALSGGPLIVNTSGSNVLMAWFSISPVSLPLATNALITFNFSGNSGNSPLIWNASDTAGYYFSNSIGEPIPTNYINGNVSLSTTSVAPSTVTANPPAIPAGSATSLSYTGGSLGTGGVAKWYSGSCGGTLVGTGNNLSVTPASLPATYYVRFEGSCNTTACVAVTVTAQNFCTPAWVPVTNMQNNMTIIGQILVNGVASLNPNDAIGAFVGTQCRGMASPTPSLNGLVFLTVASNVSSGETLTFRAWNSTTCSECNVTETEPFISQSSLGSIASPYLFHACGVTQSIVFPAGYTWFSVNIDRGSWNINTLLGAYTAGGGLTHAPAQNDMIIGQSSFATYYGTSWVGSLTSIDPKKMYIAKFTTADTLIVTGSPVTSTAISLPAGYTWIGYLPQCNKTLNNAIGPITPAPAQNDMMIGQTSFATYYGTSWVGSLASMVPSKGYKISLTNAASLTYPSCAKEGVPGCNDLVMDEVDWNTAENMQYTMNIICKVKDADGNFLSGPDFQLGSFVGNECRGITGQPDCMEGYFFLSVASNKAEGETIHFRVRMGGQVYDIVEKLPFKEGMGLGTIDQPVILTLPKNAAFITPENGFCLGNAQPNPFSNTTLIEYQLAEPANVSIKLFDCVGKLVAELLDENLDKGKYSYLLSGENLNAGVYYYQMNAHSPKSHFLETRKLILAK